MFFFLLFHAFIFLFSFVSHRSSPPISIVKREVCMLLLTASLKISSLAEFVDSRACIDYKGVLIGLVDGII